jgi:hypothetical protein
MLTWSKSFLSLGSGPPLKSNDEKASSLQRTPLSHTEPDHEPSNSLAFFHNQGLADWIVVRGLSVQKEGHAPEENEDAWAFHHDRCLIVADGATLGFESRRWAQLLVESASTLPWPPTLQDLLDWLRNSASAWRSQIAPPEPVPWYIERQLDRGSAATVLLTFFTPKSSQAITYSTVSIGDVCVFHTRYDSLVVAFPLHATSQFSSHPELARTKIDFNSVHSLRLESGTFRKGDRLFIGTDAVSEWLLRAEEVGNPQWGVCGSLDCDALTSLLITERMEGKIKNDDLTLISVSF